MTSTTSSGSRRLSPWLVVATAFMLFSMYFGAGNLIFPPVLGVEAGENFAPAIIGFLGGGVLLPVLGIIAIAVSGTNVRHLAARAGVVFGIIFPVVAYLSIGAFYALPRTGAVSFSTAIQPLTGWDSLAASAAFNFVFFGVALLLASNPSRLIDNLGKILTPILLVLLVVLIVLSIANFSDTPNEPNEQYADAPLAGGFIEGYLTMDSIASLAFGIVVINALRSAGVKPGRKLLGGVISAGAIACLLLGLIYVGLGVIGLRIEGGEQFEDGAGLLAYTAGSVLGGPGQAVFGAIVMLACLTTAVGLIAASSEFFNYLLPGVSYRAWTIIFTLVSFVLAAAGLETVLNIAAPVVEFIYPPAITLILLTLVEPMLRGKFFFYYTFRVAIWPAVAWSAMMSLSGLGLSFLEPVISWAPMHDVQLGWVLPVAIAIVVGVIADAIRPHEPPARPGHPGPAEQDREVVSSPGATASHPAA